MIEFFADNLWVLWCVAAAAFMIIELLTTALVSMWFVPSAVICAIISVFWDNFLAQVVIFFVLSFIFLLLCKKYYKPDSKKLAEANELMVGRMGIAETEINSLDGRVIVGDVHWRAVCEGKINPGSRVTVSQVNGNILKVNLLEE